jgi:autonomous glycyl radical cofactor GrcA
MQMDDGTMKRLACCTAGMSDQEVATMMTTQQHEYEKLVFRVGEEVKVKGGDFRIKSIGRKLMVLEGLPGTRIRV